MSVPKLSELSHVFSHEQSALEQLQVILEAESSALLDRDILAIEGTAQRKVTALKAYQLQVNKRLSFLLEHDFEGSEQGLLALVASYPESEQPQLTEQWQHLKQGFENVIALNERNGIVIYHNQHRNRNLLNILHGSKNEPNLYNGNGAAQGNNQRQSLGEA
jgi:flagellar biosynthesis/type III secretory pathway chaperone